MITSCLLHTGVNRPCVTTAQARAQAKLSNAYLTQLLREGKLEGFKIERDWFVYSDSLEHFLSLDRRTGPRSAKDSVA